MSNMWASRKVPLMVAGGIFAGLLYSTYGANQQPRPRTTHEASSQTPVSETLQGIAGSGGPRARATTASPRDTRIYSSDPSSASKRDATKVKGAGE
ncbi:hypothetical protein NEMBOFW57_009340 [Staphylotrichum longicolle]|uniref:Uncharacterized protein n=1 Tax=Staphylotrichum longicolle TaxID=669026 RepID=A0AAD4HVW1_9PEZI|nr:hypothetical protein NEMBOFW57_009340 [Staphylotrichum longicolle]